MNGTIRAVFFLVGLKNLPYLCSVNHRYHLGIDAEKYIGGN